MISYHDINVGYHRVKFHVVKSVNGKPIQSFKDLVLTLDSLEDPYADIETERFYRIILDRGALEDANKRITEKYHLPSLYSEGIAEWVQ